MPESNYLTTDPQNGRKTLKLAGKFRIVSTADYDQHTKEVQDWAEACIGDCVEDPTDTAQLEENYWTLCIDKANEIYRDCPDRARELAFRVMTNLGYKRP